MSYASTCTTFKYCNLRLQCLKKGNNFAFLLSLGIISLQKPKSMTNKLKQKRHYDMKFKKNTIIKHITVTMFIILNPNKHSVKTYFSVLRFNLRGEKR